MKKNMVIVVSLKRNPERRLSMKQQLGMFKIPFVFLDATDAKTYDFSSEYNEEDALRVNGMNLLPGIKGCSHSHRRGLFEFLKSDAEFCVMMEDDIEIDPLFPKSLMESLDDRRSGKTNWTYLQFDYGPNGWKGIVNWWFQFGVNAGVNKNKIRFWLYLPLYLIKAPFAHIISLGEGLHDWRHRIFGTGAIVRVWKSKYLTGCYVVTRDAAEKLISLNTPLKYSTDVWQNDARRLGLITHAYYVPRLIRQKREVFLSEIDTDTHTKNRDSKAMAY